MPDDGEWQQKPRIAGGFDRAGRAEHREMSGQNGERPQATEQADRDEAAMTREGALVFPRQGVHEAIEIDGYRV